MLNNIWASLLICFTTMFFCSSIVMAETPAIITDADPLDRNQNLVFNGSFEEPHLDNGSTFGGFLPGIDGDGYYFLSSNTVNIPIAQPDGWTTSGGGTDTYARWGNNINAVRDFPVAGQAWSSTEIHGERSVYLGNFTPAEISETPQYMPNGQVIFTSPPTITLRPEYGPDPFSISQTVAGLVPGGLYRISFWVSGEWSNLGYATINQTVAGDGIVGFQIEGYDLVYLAIPAGNAPEHVGEPHVFGTDEFHVYTLEFQATDTEMDISFLNWGHLGDTGGTVGWTRGRTTELIMDDVIINLVKLPRSVPTLSEWGLIAMASVLGIIGFMVIRRRQVAA